MSMWKTFAVACLAVIVVGNAAKYGPSFVGTLAGR